MAPNAQAGGGRGQAPGTGLRRGIRAVLLGPPGAGKGTQVRGRRSEPGRGAASSGPAPWACAWQPAGAPGVRAFVAALQGFLEPRVPTASRCIPLPSAASLPLSSRGFMSLKQRGLWHNQNSCS